jgi:hypothetical protein
MDNGLPRTIVTALCIVTCALLGLLASRFMVGMRGSAPAAILQSANPALATIAVVALMSAALAVAASIARPINAAVSLFALGCAVATLSMRSGNVSEAVFAHASFRWLGAETLAWGAFVALASVVAFRVGGPLPDVPMADPEQSLAAALGRPRALLAALGGIAIVPVLLFTLVGPSKGQAIGACVLAGAATAVVARLYASREQPVLLFAAPVLVLGAVQLALAGATVGTLDATFAAGSLSPLLVAMPSDVAAGSLCGVAIGLGWSKGLVKPDPLA